MRAVIGQCAGKPHTCALYRHYISYKIEDGGDKRGEDK